MNRIALTICITLLSFTLFSQSGNSLKYCDCIDYVEKIDGEYSGDYKRTCNKTVVETGDFVNGKKDGVWKSYSKKGTLIKTVNYSKGKLDGKIEQFYLNGNPKLVGNFSQSKKVGTWSYYTDKNKLILEGKYDSNIPIEIWTAYDKKGKKPAFQYDYAKNKNILSKSLMAHKDGDLLQSENTEEWYILRSPELNKKSKTQPFGGYAFANYIMTNIVEVPIDIWDTFLYRKYLTVNTISSDHELSFEMEVKSNSNVKEIDYVFLIVTNPTEKIKEVAHSELQLYLLDSKINEAYSCMPPWIYGGDSEVEVTFHYVINRNMHK